MAIVDGNPVNASYTNTRVMSKQNDNSISGFISTAKYLACERENIATSATINSLVTNSGFVNFTGSTATALNGIAGGANGRLLLLFNGSSAIITIANESGSATASERIITPTGEALELAPNNSILLVYSTQASRWVFAASAGGGGPGDANKEKITLDGTDISNGYVDLSQEVALNTLQVVYSRSILNQDEDYTLSLEGGVTRVTFAGDFAASGDSALVEGDELYFQYFYE